MAAWRCWRLPDSARSMSRLARCAAPPVVAGPARMLAHCLPGCLLCSPAHANQCSPCKQGPLDNLADHLASPWTTTFVDNGVSVPGF